MSRKHLYRLADKIQRELLTYGHPIDRAPRVLLDTWSSLSAWNQAGEKTWRISHEQAEILLDTPLPATLPLATAPTRGPAVCYILPDLSEWIILARISALHKIIIQGDISWAYSQPVLTYCTALESGPIAAGYVNLTDQPTPDRLHLQPGTASRRGKLSEAEITEEDYRLSLAIAQHYRP